MRCVYIYIFIHISYINTCFIIEQIHLAILLINVIEIVLNSENNIKSLVDGRK